MPRGAETRAVRRGLGRAGCAVRVVSVPLGASGARAAAEQALHIGRTRSALVIGVCGALAPGIPSGDALVYDACVAEGEGERATDSDLSALVLVRVGTARGSVRGLQWHRVVTQPADKRRLGERYACEAVDMESYALLEALAQAGTEAAVLRVVSDARDTELPDLNRALTPEGAFAVLPMALAMLAKPEAALRMTLDALRALRALENVAALIGAN